MHHRRSCTCVRLGNCQPALLYFVSGQYFLYGVVWRVPAPVPQVQVRSVHGACAGAWAKAEPFEHRHKYATRRLAVRTKIGALDCSAYFAEQSRFSPCSGVTGRRAHLAKPSRNCSVGARRSAVLRADVQHSCSEVTGRRAYLAKPSRNWCGCWTKRGNSTIPFPERKGIPQHYRTYQME
jgi:hypothetical protein